MKIALVAMSGVRCCDEELKRLGLTLPGFVERSETIASLPSLGLLTLAAMSRPQHDCHYIEVGDLRELKDLPTGYDLVAISSFTAQILEAYELADRYRALGIPVVLGGLHVTALPDEAAQHADAIVVGEGETTWQRLLSDAASGKIQKRYVADGEFPLHQAPLPAYDMLTISAYNRLTVQASRGCPWVCEFCGASIMLTSRYKQKPIDRVISEIDFIRGLWPKPFLEFADDNAFVNKRYWKRLLPELRARKLRWFAETDISVADDDELLKSMAQSGCVEVLVGLESPVSEGLGGVELKRNWKLKRLPDYLLAVRRIQSHGIRVNGCFVVGLDGHTPEIFDAVYQFARDSELFDVQITLPTPFPGTALYRRLKREGRLLHDGEWGRYTLFDINFIPAGMSGDELRAGFHDLVSRIYCDEMTRWRRDTFRHKYSRFAKRGKGVST